MTVGAMVVIAVILIAVLIMCLTLAQELGAQREMVQV